MLRNSDSFNPMALEVVRWRFDQAYIAKKRVAKRTRRPSAAERGDKFMLHGIGLEGDGHGHSAQKHRCIHAVAERMQTKRIVEADTRALG